MEQNNNHRLAYKMPNTTRYMNLFLLVVAGGIIYPMLYMRQIYLDSILLAFNINNAQLGQLYSMLGLLFFLTYAPSGWLADKVKPMLLVSISLLGTGMLGFWYSTLPSMTSLYIIYAGWGCTTGLTFWGAAMKRIKVIARDGETGRFYGIFEGGRGAIEAILASIALFIFASSTGEHHENTIGALVNVIHMYSWGLIILAGVSFIALYFETKEIQEKTSPKKEKTSFKETLHNIGYIVRIPAVWLIALIITAGYHLFWATYSFSSYLQNGGWGFTAVMAGTITTIKLWLRPLGGIGGGFIGDKFSNLKVLNIVMALSIIGLLGLIYTPFIIQSHFAVYFCIFFILFVGLMTYMIRGLYWAIIEYIDIPEKKLGLAIGIISVIGYCPDIFIPLVNGYLVEQAKTVEAGLRQYFLYTIGMTSVGLISGLILAYRAKHKNKNQAHARLTAGH